MSPESHSKHRRLWTAGLAVTTLTVISAAVLGLRPAPVEANPSAGAPSATPVSVATVEQREVATWDEFSGRLEAVERVDIRSRVAGTVQAVHFREGGLVKAGDLLVTIDPAPYAAEADRAAAQVAAAQSRVAFTTSEHERAQRLWEQRAIAEREFEERANARRAADAELRAAQAALQSARLNLGYTQVRAPVSGRVGKLEITVGNLVAAGPGAPVLTTLVSVSPIYASFDANEQIVARALQTLRDAHGKAARIESIPVQMATTMSQERIYAGHLQLVDNQVDARSGTVRVRAVFDNADESLMAGQFAKLRMGRPKAEPAVLIDERAIGTDQSRRFVLVVDADNKTEYREITLGGTAEGLRIVSAGLQPGERIVVNGLQRVRPGSLVAPQAVAMDDRMQVRSDRAVRAADAANSPQS
ncbi:efflux RND transporter periplasmic adaptor subunit [Aromatoleum toluclasticum]|uniref:efflux RND transporter periplasmic adaptor subunit n=1 Tax=Aromatoleum toluclasticum TaxID=92003 RepID=UPI001D18725D|nr:efflux RND transporter periplasmic adaptor subunit [Aromatoleum toluclasticum]MCC4115986.1 efflux RND transporter periplasmic adaptor subunit [Aromatoleum toluclasticum]